LDGEGLHLYQGVEAGRFLALVLFLSLRVYDSPFLGICSHGYPPVSSLSSSYMFFTIFGP
jgi:hypothetical protein